MASMKSGWALLAVSAAALAACGSSRNSAPVVYGTQPTTSGRIYNSPAEVQARAPAYGQTAYSQPTYQAPPSSYGSSSSPARLIPVTQTAMLSETPPSATYVSSYEPVKSPPSGLLLVTVQPGDTVYAIARRTGAGPQAIIAENGLRPPYQLRVGDTLRIPPALGSGFSGGHATPVAAPVSSMRTVAMGETLFSISRSTGVPVQTIAAANRLQAPYTLRVGQQLVIPGAQGAQPPRQREASMDVGDLAREVSYKRPEAPRAGSMFDWPVKGAVIAEFGSMGLGRRNEGVNIAAPVGTPVRAAAEGEVVYRGSELDGYGNLLLIKHGDGFVTAYAHNDVMLVRKGQRVQQGQIIAKVGQTGAVTEPQLHFEIRQNLKSVDPLAFLQ